MLLYSIPKTFGAVENRVDVDMIEVEVCISETVRKGFYPCDADIFELWNILMEENTWDVPSNGYKAVSLYTNLRRTIKLEIT